MSQTQAAEMEFALKYDGPAVETGRMSARELGPAILATAVLLERTSELVYGEGGRVHVEVKADFRRGSFLIDFSVLSQYAEQYTHLTGDDLRLILEILGVTTAGGLIGFVKWLRGRKPDRIQSDASGNTTIIINDNSITLNMTETKVFFDSQVRDALNGIVEPLKKPGITSVALGPARSLTQQIDKDEAHFFDQPSKEEPVVSVDYQNAVLEVIAPAFRDGNKWRFQHSGGSFWAAITDQEFLSRVAGRKEKFGAGDALKVRARVTTTRGPDGLRYDWEIIEVIEHIPGGGDQLSLI